MTPFLDIWGPLSQTIAATEYAMPYQKRLHLQEKLYIYYISLLFVHISGTITKVDNNVGCVVEKLQPPTIEVIFYLVQISSIITSIASASNPATSFSPRRMLSSSFSMGNLHELSTEGVLYCMFFTIL